MDLLHSHIEQIKHKSIHKSWESLKRSFQNHHYDSLTNSMRDILQELLKSKTQHHHQFQEEYKKNSNGKMKDDKIGLYVDTMRKI